MSHTIKTKVTTEITITLTEGEARVLDAICGYGPKIFKEWFYKTHGQYYLQKHQQHIDSFFEKGRSLGAAFYEIEKARASILKLDPIPQDIEKPRRHSALYRKAALWLPKWGNKKSAKEAVKI